VCETQLQHVERVLLHYKPRKKLIRPFLKRSAVAIILQEVQREVRILMIKRAERDGDPWSGHMAFPGGRMDSDDRHGFDVAVRETEEEIGLTLGEADPCIGRLSEIMTHPQIIRRPMVVSPYIFRLDRDVEFNPNYEVAEVLWVPLEFLLNRSNVEKMVWERKGVEIPLPCYRYEGRQIWGLSLMMLDEFLGLLGSRRPARW
jgi:8-oxo-dGTP pyrophosphatase MutT (NUDIX family)